MPPTCTTPNRRKFSREKREGAALLIVLFILMMATGTAVFALQSTQFEQRAAGSLLQAARTRYVAEAATMGVLASCDERGTAGCADVHGDVAGASNYFTEAQRKKYSLSPWGTREPVFQLDNTILMAGLTADPTSSRFKAPVVADDHELNPSGTATAFTPSFMTVIEKWQVPNLSEGRDEFRLVVSTYGELQIAAENAVAVGQRGGHSSVSVTRAFFDVKE
jgi:hypothetical protein